MARPRERGLGEGSLQRMPDGTWRAQVTVGYTAGGRRRYRTKGGYRSKQAARAGLAELLAEKAAGGTQPLGRSNLADYLAAWLDTLTLAPKTLGTYRWAVDHLGAALGHHRLADLSGQHLAAHYAAALASGLAPASISIQHRVAHAALAQAVRWRLLARNPADDARPPRLGRSRAMALSPEQVRAFLTAAQADRLHAFYLAFLLSGLRPGELFALTWDDIDWQRSALVVRASKTAAGVRRVPVDASVTDALYGQRLRQAEEREAAGDRWQERGLVFTTTTGTALSRANLIQRSFRPLLAAAGLPRMRLYDLRHTHATLLLAANVHPRVVAERLGHADVKVTLNTYSHVLSTMQDEAVARLAALLGHD